MNRKTLKTAVIWGLVLWLFGYVLGIVLFKMVPPAMLGWMIMPFGILFTLWVLMKKIQLASLSEYVVLGAIWAIMAVVLDYFLLVKLFKPVDGYYKLDVYVYYLLTLAMPILFGGWRLRKGK